MVSDDATSSAPCLASPVSSAARCCAMAPPGDSACTGESVPAAWRFASCSGTRSAWLSGHWPASG